VRVRTRAADHGFAFADLLPAFLACSRTGDGPVGFDAFHPTERGHECAAAALAERVAGLASGGLRPAAP
jgi:hypothetical protein